MCQESELRHFISQIDLDEQVAIWSRKSRLPKEEIKDHALQIIVKLLEKEFDRDQELAHFPGLKAFLNYWYVATVRSVYSAYRQQGRQQELLEQELPPMQQEAPPSTEERLIAGEWLQQALERELKPTVTPKVYKDCVLLVETVLTAPKRFIQQRASGKEKGMWSFRYVELSKALSWNRVRLYKRCHQLKEALLSFGA